MIRLIDDYLYRIFIVLTETAKGRKLYDGLVEAYLVGHLGCDHASFYLIVFAGTLIKYDWLLK